jgi:hypothetical protein
MPLQGSSQMALFVPKLLAWTVRLALLLPLSFLFCSGVSRSMWLDVWAADRLTAERKLTQGETFEPWVGTERGDP